jgi:predicted AlkP superfamily pyrophosphatase or phosphodiesterase
MITGRRHFLSVRNKKKKNERTNKRIWECIMNKGLFLLLLSIAAGVLKSHEIPVDKDAETNHVILISIDGLAAYHLENEHLELPNLRELIEQGVWAEGSQSVFPSVTHPSHATLITGVSPRKHGILDNRMTNRETGDSHHPTTQLRSEAIHTQTLFDASRQAGLTTAAICWPETRKDSSVDLNILHGHDELDPAEVDPAFMDVLRQAGIPIDSYYDWAPEGRMIQGVRDLILAKATAEVIRSRQPEFIAVHFLVTDTIQHGWGPDHYMSHAALTHADFTLGLLRQAVEDAGLKDRTTFVIAADHGFHSVYHEVNIHPVLQESGLADRIRLHGSGWRVFVETTDEFDEEQDRSALESFFADILALEGLERVIRPEEFHDLGYPLYEESPYVPGQYIIIPDIDTFLTVDSSSDSSERKERAQPSHTHGYLPDHPRMHPALILSGNGIREGQRLGVVRNHDVAPTIARILGLDLPDTEGEILFEALDE